VLTRYGNPSTASWRIQDFFTFSKKEMSAFSEKADTQRNDQSFYPLFWLK